VQRRGGSCFATRKTLADCISRLCVSASIEHRRRRPRRRRRRHRVPRAHAAAFITTPAEANVRVRMCALKYSARNNGEGGVQARGESATVHLQVPIARERREREDENAPCNAGTEETKSAITLEDRIEPPRIVPSYCSLLPAKMHSRQSKRGGGRGLWLDRTS